MVKKILTGIGILVLVLAVWQYELLVYGISQARGQLKIIYESREIEKVLQDPQVPDSLKQKLKLVQEIKAFAIDSLGVQNSDSYTTLYNQHGKPVLWVVTACEPFSMEDKKWNFPILGSFSYKGFFDYDKAIKEKKKLTDEGYDTGIRTVSAWSTLGILNDPIMSGMLFRHVGDLANTVIHELTHGTIFIKNDLKFNENLASFIGNEGARKFLRYKYGKNSPQYQYYDTYMSDRKRYVNHMLRSTQHLDSLYQSFTPDMPDSVKAVRKSEAIRNILIDMDTIRYENQYYLKLTDNLQQKDPLPNNTFFRSYVRYEADLDEFNAVFKNEFNKNLKAYLTYLKEKHNAI